MTPTSTERRRYAMLGVVLLAPLSLGAALLGGVLAISGGGLREGHAPSEPTGLITACLFVAGLLFIWWIACMVIVWRRVRRERAEEATKDPIPRATIVANGRSTRVS